MRLLVRIATLGYALPGTVLAVGVFIVFSRADGLLVDIIKAVSGFEADALMLGTVFIVIAAYMVRFMAAGFNPVSSAMNRITPCLDEASVSMGVTGISLLRRIHLPILRNGLFTTAVLVFVDVMKEMPITLMTRPFGWDTLAVKIYELTSEGEWERAALPAVAFESPDSGEIVINKTIVSNREDSMPPEKRRIGMIFQDYALFPHLCVKENISFGLHKMRPVEKDKRVAELLELVGLTDVSGHSPTNFQVASSSVSPWQEHWRRGRSFC